MLTPLAIAVYRYVLLDEVTQHYALNLADQRFQRVFGVAVAFRPSGSALGFGYILGHFAFDMPMVRAGRLRQGPERISFGYSS